MKMRLTFLFALSLILQGCGENKRVNAEPDEYQHKEHQSYYQSASCDSVNIAYDSEGRLVKRGCITNGKKVGYWDEWVFQNGEIGRIHKIIFYNNGIEKFEEDTSWYNGQNKICSLKKRIYYRRDSIFSYHIAFHKNGNPSNSTSSINSLLHGASKIWHENGHITNYDSAYFGNIIFEKKYNPENIVLISEKYYDKRGKLESEKNYDPENGKLLVEKKCKNGKVIWEKKY
jgi:antitoxin component YwqK of YwqJK toxin-antitoxin module